MIVGRCFRYVGEAGVPAAEVVGEVVIEHPGTDLEEQVRTTWAPAHLLFFDHAFADDLVDRGLDECGGDDLTGPTALAVVRPKFRDLDVLNQGVDQR